MNNDIIIALVGAIFASTGFWTFVNQWIDRHHKTRTDLEEGMLCILHDRVYFLCKHHLKSESISSDDYDNLKKLFGSYTRLGGNGTAEKLMKEVEKKPIVDE